MKKSILETIATIVGAVVMVGIIVLIVLTRLNQRHFGDLTITSIGTTNISGSPARLFQMSNSVGRSIDLLKLYTVSWKQDTNSWGHRRFELPGGDCMLEPGATKLVAVPSQCDIGPWFAAFPWRERRSGLERSIDWIGTMFGQRPPLMSFTATSITGNITNGVECISNNTSSSSRSE